MLGGLSHAYGLEKKPAWLWHHSFCGPQGLQAARARGRLGGRPKALTASQQKRAVGLYQEKRWAVKEICTMMGISKPTLYASVRQAHSSS
jgi:transposase